MLQQTGLAIPIRQYFRTSRTVSDQVQEKATWLSKADPDGFWDMFSLSEVYLGPLALRPVTRTKHPFVSNGCLCCSWLIYSVQDV